MSAVIKNLLGLVVGIIAGSLVNIALVNIGPIVIPLPEGADVSTMESLSESMKLFTPINFLFPFLGHALGTLAGAFAAAKIASSHQMKFAVGVGFAFLLGGISAVNMIGGPFWFIILDLGLAYIPMGVLGGLLAKPKPVA